MAHAHTTWLSDVVNPVPSLGLGYGCTLQFAPEVCNHWMVGDSDSGVVAATKPPGWWDFMLRVPMNGQFGLSGRIYEWSDPIRARTAANVALYKRIRGTIAGADVYHLTPPPHRTHPTGWMAIQYVAPGARQGVVLAYRLANGRAEERFRLRGLMPAAVYDVSENGRRLLRASGAELAARGLRVSLAAEWRAGVVEVNCTAHCVLRTAQ
jgi:alpha-galactosidase